TERLGRPPTLEEVGRVLKLSKRKLGILAQAIEVNRLTPHPESSEEDGTILGELLTDDRSKSPEDLLFEADDIERVLSRLDGLDRREAAVIRMRFGLSPYCPMTLREVGERLGLTRERVRQLENHAMGKLMGRAGRD